MELGKGQAIPEGFEDGVSGPVFRGIMKAVLAGFAVYYYVTFGFGVCGLGLWFFIFALSSPQKAKLKRRTKPEVIVVSLSNYIY